LSVDIGLRRIGLALSDPTATIARPWKVVPGAESPEAIVETLLPVVEDLRRGEDGLAGIVVGLPRRLDGSPTTLTGLVRSVGEALARAVPVAVAFQDERLTSKEAESRLALRQRDWRGRKALIDAASAAVTLQDFLDDPSGRGRSAGSAALGDPPRS
jgi:putative Holliday junction resolvase